MMYNTQIYWVFGLYPSSGILETRKHNVSETDPVSETLYFFLFLEYRTLDKVQNPSNSESLIYQIHCTTSCYKNTIKC
jgi:hypothetical protein